MPAGYVGFNNHGWTSRYNPPAGMSTIYQFGFTDPDAPTNSYSKYSNSQIAVTLDMTSQVTQRWELKAGGSIENWTYRSFTVGNIQNYLLWIDPNQETINIAVAAASVVEVIMMPVWNAPISLSLSFPCRFSTRLVSRIA